MGRNRKYPELYDHRQLTQLLTACGSGRAVARELGCSPAMVSRAIHALGIPPNPTGKPRIYPELYDPAQRKQLMEKYGSYHAIARHLGCGQPTVSYAFRKMMVD